MRRVRDDASKAERSTLKPLPVGDSITASDSKPSIESLEVYTGTRYSEMVYQEGTCSATWPLCGIMDCTLKETVRTAFGTASFSEELTRLTLFLRIICC